MRQQNGGHVLMAGGGGIVERGCAGFGFAGVGVGAEAKEECGEIGVAGQSGVMEGSSAHTIPRAGIRAVSQQNPPITRSPLSAAR